jgi:hypothetical protein
MIRGNSRGFVTGVAQHQATNRPAVRFTDDVTVTVCDHKIVFSKNRDHKTVVGQAAYCLYRTMGLGQVLCGPRNQPASRHMRRTASMARIARFDLSGPTNNCRGLLASVGVRACNASSLLYVTGHTHLTPVRAPNAPRSHRPRLHAHAPTTHGTTPCRIVERRGWPVAAGWRSRLSRSFHNTYTPVPPNSHAHLLHCRGREVFMVFANQEVRGSTAKKASATESDLDARPHKSGKLQATSILFFSHHSFNGRN